MAEDRLRVSSDRLVDLRAEEPTQLWHQTQGGKIGARDLHPFAADRLTFVGDVEAKRTMCRDVREGRLVPAKIPEHGVAEDCVTPSCPITRVPPWFGSWCPEVHESLWLHDRERTEQDLIEEGENCGVGADTERQGNEGHAGDHGGLQKCADCEPYVPGHWWCETAPTSASFFLPEVRSGRGGVVSV